MTEKPKHQGPTTYPSPSSHPSSRSSTYQGPDQAQLKHLVQEPTGERARLAAGHHLPLGEEKKSGIPHVTFNTAYQNLLHSTWRSSAQSSLVQGLADCSIQPHSLNYTNLA